MGFFEGAGNLLDLPASSLRDLLGGENPFDQYLDPFGTENRLDITELTGLEGTPAWLADMILDPVNLIGGAGIIKNLPKMLKAYRASKAAKASSRAAATTRAAQRASGRQGRESMRSNQIGRLKEEFSDATGVSSLDDITEAMLEEVGATLPKPLREFIPGATGEAPLGIVRRAIGGVRGAPGAAKRLGATGWRGYRSLPRPSQAAIGAKLATGLGTGFTPTGLFEEEAIPDLSEALSDVMGDHESMDIVISELKRTSGATTNEPLNMADPIELLLRNNAAIQPIPEMMWDPEQRVIYDPRDPWSR
jgi:hypothetical protein